MAVGRGQQGRGKFLFLGVCFTEEAKWWSSEARSAELKRNIKTRRAEPAYHILDVEYRTAEGWGPQGRGKILRVVNLWGNGSELDSGSPHVIMPKGVS